MWVWLLAGLAVLVILFYSRPRENMTNDQLISTLQAFGDKGTAPIPVKPIYGPSANPPAVPTNTGGGKNGQSVAGPYPQIFGPDVTNSPGTTTSGLSGGVGGVGVGGIGVGGGVGGVGANGGSANGYVFSDQPGPQDQTHEFNPDLKNAFPFDGPPQPFLTDFSKIQH